MAMLMAPFLASVGYGLDQSIRLEDARIAEAIENGVAFPA
jgi:hypothetical protein